MSTTSGELKVDLLTPGRANQIETQLREMLELHPNGGKLPSVRELSQHFRAGPQTVSRCLQALEDEGLVVRRRGSGTFVCREDDIRRPVGRAVVALALENLHREFFGRIATGFFNAAGQKDVVGSFCPIPSLSPEWLEANAVSGLAIGLAPYPSKTTQLHDAIEHCKAQNIPIVSLHAENHELTTFSVLIDNVSAGSTIAQHIVDANGPVCYLGNLQGTIDLDRLNGLQAVMREHGRDDLVIEALLGKPDPRELDKVFDRVFAHQPGAVFLAFPPLYPLLETYMLRHGHHNVQLAVFSESEPDIRADIWRSAVAEKPSEELGAAALTMLTELLNGKHDRSKPHRVELKCRIYEPDDA